MLISGCRHGWLLVDGVALGYDYYYGLFARWFFVRFSCLACICECVLCLVFCLNTCDDVWFHVWMCILRETHFQFFCAVHVMRAYFSLVFLFFATQYIYQCSCFRSLCRSPWYAP